MGVKVREWDGGRGGKLAWWIFIDHQRKRQAKKIGTGPEAKKQAEEAARVIEARLVMGDLGVFEPPPVALTLEQFSELRLQDYVQRNLRHTTSEKYEEVLRLRWLPKLGQLPLRKLSRQHIRNAVKAFHREGLSNSTIRWQDESPVYVKEQLGHSSIRITVDIYGSSICRDNKRGRQTRCSSRGVGRHPQARRK